MQRYMQPENDPLVIFLYILAMLVYFGAQLLLYAFGIYAVWYLFKKFCNFILGLGKTQDERLAKERAGNEHTYKIWAMVLCGACIFVGAGLILLGLTGNSNVEIGPVKIRDTPAGVVFLVVGLLILKQVHK